MTYDGYIFNVLNSDGEYNGSYNDLYIIFSGTVSHSEKDFHATNVYYPVRFSNISKNGDDVSYSENAGISGNSDLLSFRYSTKGYTNPSTCYMELVESNRDKYVSEVGDGFEIYADQKTISKISDISETYRDELATDAKDIIESYVASDYGYSQGSHLNDLTIKGEYLLVAKNQGTDFEKNNKYIIVFSGTVSNDDGKFEASPIYLPVQYDGVVSFPNDEYMVTASQGILGTSIVGNYWLNTKGYVDGNQMFSDIVTANRDVYTYEVSDGLKEFGE